MGKIQTKEATESSINYERLLNTFIQVYPDAIWIKDRFSNIINANKAYYKYSEQVDFHTIEQDINKTFIEQEIEKFSIKTKDKSQTLSITSIPILNNNSVENILYVSQNITEQEELKERFFVNKYQLNALLENIPKIIYMKDLNGNYITGTKFSHDFFLSGEDYINKLKLNFKSIKKNRIIEDKSVVENNKLLSYETEIYDTSSIPHWYTIYKAPINDYNNNVIGIIVMVNNIDDEKLLQAQRETFVASLGHDLKNPTLAQIRALELLLKGDFGIVPKEQAEIIQMVLDSCKYMNSMLCTLLTTYRNEGGIVKLNYETISLKDLADESIGEMYYMAKDKNIEFELINDSKNPCIIADKVQIKRVLMNLLSNGIKYAFKNTTIKLRLYNKDNFTYLNFENKSPYIPLDKRDAIFGQYVSFAEAHKEFGVGLGLYASKKIVNAHGGDIIVESHKDDRNIFCFNIPNKWTTDNVSQTVTF